jgi:gliding motility-associated protein GldL
MLIIGLSTEAVIFVFSSFEPLHEDPDWTLVYPELATAHDEEDLDGIAELHENPQSVTDQLDNMLAQAKIEPELIESLGQGLRSLSSTASQLGQVSNATVATEGYVQSVTSATEKVNQLADSYARASHALTGLSETSAPGTSAGEQMQKMSENLTALNASYETQLRGANEHIATTNEMYKGISELMSNLNESVEDTKRYKENIAELSKNLTALNTVYGNMLSAMNFGGGGASH